MFPAHPSWAETKLRLQKKLFLQVFLIEMRALQLGVLFFHLEKAFFYTGYLNTEEWETKMGTESGRRKMEEKKMKERKKEKLRMTEWNKK